MRVNTGVYGVAGCSCIVTERGRELHTAVSRHCCASSYRHKSTLTILVQYSLESTLCVCVRRLGAVVAVKEVRLVTFGEH